MSNQHDNAQPSRRTAIGAGIGAAIMGIGSLGAQPASAAQPLMPLHIATNVSESAANGYYALDKGFFKDAGIDATVDTFSGSGVYTNGIIAGTFDIGSMPSGSLVTAHSKGLEYVLLANGGVFNYQSPQTMLVVPKDSPLKNAADFKGKTISVSLLRDIVQVAVMEWLEKNGVDYRSVNFVELPAMATTAALTSGRVDAAFLGEPYLTQSLDVLKPIASPNTSVANHFLVVGWTTSRTWLTANPELARRFQQAMSRASAWAMKNRTEATEILAARAKTPMSVALKSHHVSWEPNPSPVLIQPIVDLMVKYGFVASGFPATELFS
jgi:NitT/TauT family transport system substrate-binding protein